MKRIKRYRLFPHGASRLGRDLRLIRKIVAELIREGL